MNGAASHSGPVISAAGASSQTPITADEMDFRDTSFFASHKTLIPTPAQIAKIYPSLQPRARGVARFPQWNLFVKCGNSNRLRLEEAQTMRAIRKAFPNGEVPVPEVFGWCRVGKAVYIYMSLVRGEMLLRAWPSFDKAQREFVRDQVAAVVVALRSLRQRPGEPNKFIGSINGGVVQDRMFRKGREDGPFHTIKSFNDYCSAVATRQKPSKDVPYEKDHLRDGLPDTGEIFFTHGDIRLLNLIFDPVSAKLLAVIDWEQSGWFPEWWEYFKLMFEDYRHSWRADGYADGVMKAYEAEDEVLENYHDWLGHP